MTLLNIMDASESLSNKILEEKQVEKFSQFIEKYGENVNALKKKLKGRESVPVSTATDVPESVSLFNLTGFNQFSLAKSSVFSFYRQ